MLRDRLVVGIRDGALSAKLQLEATLTLEKAKKTIRQKEAVQEQHQQLQADSSRDKPIVLDQVHSNTGGARGLYFKSQWSESAAGSASRRAISQGSDSTTVSSRQCRATSQCRRCGKQQHQSGEVCPAGGATCHRCNRRGHFQAQCFSKTIATSTNELSLDTAFLGSVDSRQESSWTITLGVENKVIPFKLDTGAEVTVISDTAYQSLNRIKLQTLQRPKNIRRTVQNKTEG